MTITFAAKPANPYLGEPEVSIAVHRLMRRLPDDITNVGALTLDQAQMAEALSQYANATAVIIVEGISEIATLVKAMENQQAMAPNLRRLLAFLRDECTFLLDASVEYFSVSMEGYHKPED